MVQDRLEEKQISFTRNYDRKLPRVTLDLLRMMQVFTNLYLNAIQAMGLRGKIKVTTSLDQRAEGKGVKVTFADNGIGISPEERASIFEPFYTTRSDGTGLGLTIVRKIVEQHDGKVEVESKVGKYTRFKVFLPLKPRDASLGKEGLPDITSDERQAFPLAAEELATRLVSQLSEGW